MAIVRWDPFRSLDRIFEDDFPLNTYKASVPSDLSVDVYEKGNDVIAEMHLAGMNPENIDVSVEDNYLRVTGCKEEAKEEKDKSYYYKEIQRGSFERTIRLPMNVRDDQAKASYENGVLKVVIPKEDVEKKHKKVKVEVKGK